MVERYSSPAMASVWSEINTVYKWFTIEQAVARSQIGANLIKAGYLLNDINLVFEEFNSKPRVFVARMKILESKTRHEFNAFIDAVHETGKGIVVSDDLRFFHYGLTSSDVQDTAQILKIKDALTVLKMSYKNFLMGMVRLSHVYKNSVMPGRTHGRHAEPTTFGFTIAGHALEIKYAFDQLEKSVQAASVFKATGAVGLAPHLNDHFLELMAKELGLQYSWMSTQVISRIHLAPIINALAVYGAAIERLATFLRLLSLSEIDEIQEDVPDTNKGSSAMPHKINPVSFENIVGLSRMLRSYQGPAMENVNLWFERDMTHSSPERSIFEDAFGLAYYMSIRMTNCLSSLKIDDAKMLANFKRHEHEAYSSRALVELIDVGVSREDAYSAVKRSSYGVDDSYFAVLNPKGHFKNLNSLFERRVEMLLGDI